MYQQQRAALIIDMRSVVSISQHLKPQRLIHEIKVLIGGLDDVARRPRSRDWIAFVRKKSLEELPPKLKLNEELIDNAALNEGAGNVLAGRLSKHGKGIVIVIKPSHTAPSHPA